MTAMGVIFDPMSANISVSGIASVDFDALIEEGHEWSNDISTSPVENGSQIADHIIPSPDKFKCTAMISDSSIFGFNDGDTESLTQKTFNLLRQLHEDRQPVVVYTKYFTYVDMAISSIGIPRSGANGDSLQFSMEFTNIRIVNTQTAKVPDGISKKLDKKSTDAMNKKTDPKKNGGGKQPEEERGSVLSGIFGKLSGGK